MLLSSDIWVYALIRRAELAGAFATILRKGDARGGAVLVKTLDRRTGVCRLWSEAVGHVGEPVWMHPLPGDSEVEVDAYLVRAARIDPDIWIVEIEDRDGGRFLTEEVDGR